MLLDHVGPVLAGLYPGALIRVYDFLIVGHLPVRRGGCAMAILSFS
jgi:hypothetical protein